MLLTIVLLCVCLFLTHVFVSYYNNSANNQVPVLPGRLPILGHMHLVLINDAYELLTKIGNIILESGGVCKFMFGPFPSYIVTDPEDALTVLQKCLDKAFVYDFVEPMLGKSLLIADVPTWKRNRRIVDLGFKQHVLDKYLELFNDNAEELARLIAKEVGRGEVDLTDKVTRSVLETTCKTTMGTKVYGQALVNDNYINAVNTFLEILMIRVGKPWLFLDFIFNRTNYRKQSLEALKIFLDLTDQMVKLRKSEYLQRLKSKENFDQEYKFQSLLDILIENNQLTNDDLKNIVNNILIAAFDTTIQELLIILVCIGTYPDVQAKICQEIQQVLGDDGTVTKDNISQLVYLDTVIKETVRLYPIGPIVGRKAATDTKLRNVTIPAGSNIGVHIWAINRNIKYWGLDANKFKPERWLNPVTLPDHPAAYATFSPGRRGCVGKTYVLMYLKATLVPILRQFKLSSDHMKMKLDLKVMVRPKSGHHIKIESR